MEKDCEIYVDPEEEEVFFGCISEKEKNLCAKLANQEEVDPKNNYKNNAVEPLELVVQEENNKNILRIDGNQLDIVHKEIIVNDPLGSIITNQCDKSVEVEHNYSTAMKPRIDKSILTTPKSIVKADKDGGFLKVLSEIALVKAEAEGDKVLCKREDENKENKITQQIPEIRVTEATPERTVLSPPISINKQTHQCRSIYNTPNDNKFEQKSHSDVEKGIKISIGSVQNIKRSIDLIDLGDVDILNDIKLKECVQESNNTSEINLECSFINLNDTEESEDDVKITKVCESPKDMKITVPDVKSLAKTVTQVPNQPLGLRFSTEARKIVEVLKTTFDDTLNFTVAEIDVENEENSFVSPEPAAFDKTELIIEEVEKLVPKHNKFLCKTVEKDFHKTKTILPQSKLEPVKHFSERKVYHQVDSRSGIKKCVKKLPLEEKRSISVEKMKDVVPSSRIPIFGIKNAKTISSDQIPRAVSAKIMTNKTPVAKTNAKNSKFNHIESPISAYIHNKQTALVMNVKPGLSGISKLQTIGSALKPSQAKSQTTSIPVPKKSSQLQCSATIRLPFVEYKSATPYAIEKIPESRLPRLSPSVQKLIGTHSPRVLKHEGRFYLTTPRKTNLTENNTIIADPNEVSIVVCKSAQKSNTIK